jgi:hypothetical protein
VRVVLGSEFWVLGSRFWVLSSGFWVLGSEFWVLGSGFWVLGLPAGTFVEADCDSRFTVYYKISIVHKWIKLIKYV